MRLRPNTMISLLLFLSLAVLYVGGKIWQARTTQSVVITAETQWLDVNKASFRELTTLPGIGSGLAKRIVALRDTRHGFVRLEELLAVHGIGEKKLERIRSKLKIIPKYNEN
jgi:competence ComEA-like helix-hairpin-helix protein